MKKLRKKLYYPQATPKALLFFTLPVERKEIARSFSLQDNFARLSKYAVPQEYPAERRVQASDPEDTALATFLVATISNPRIVSQFE